MRENLSKPQLTSNRRTRALALALWLVGPGAATGLLGQPATDSQPVEEATWSVGIVLVDGVYNTELVAPYDVFEHVAHQGGGETDSIRVFTVSPDGGAVTTAEGMRIEPDFGFNTAPEIDILVVPSAENSRGTDLDNAVLIEFVRQRGRTATLSLSLCWGAFVLGEAGLLDGRSATTFPSDYDALARRFPETDVRVNVSFVHDGPVITSQGGVMSYEAALYAIELLFGSELATAVGGGLLVRWPRPTSGSLPPFVSDAAFEASDDP